jgi:glycosyltransferase involved in cell wall biosynthesis
MKIAMIGNKCIPSRSGGVEIHMEEITKRLANKEFEMDVDCRKEYCDIIEESPNKYLKLLYTPYINTKHLDAITHTFTSTIAAIFAGCDVFHYHALGPATLSFIPRILGKKVVCTVHGLDWQRGKWGGFATKFLKFGEFASARFPNCTINVSENLVGYYRDKYGVETVYIPNGVEKPEMKEPDLIKKDYSLEKDGYILFLARLVQEKGAHYLIEAYKKLKTDKKLVIAGGSSHSSDYEKELHELAGDNENIIFTGFVNGAKLMELYSNAYLYVLPSDIEGLPISLLEAMSYGNCCVTSDIPENLSVIKEYGYSFRKADTMDLHEKLNLLIDNEDKVKEIKSQASDYILGKYNWDDICRQTVVVYQNLFNVEQSK